MVLMDLMGLNWRFGNNTLIFNLLSWIIVRIKLTIIFHPKDSGQYPWTLSHFPHGQWFRVLNEKAQGINLAKSMKSESQQNLWI